MQRLMMALLVALTILMAGTPVAAKEREKVKLPKLTYVGTMRHRHELTFNGQVLQTCQADWEGWNRRYERCEHKASVPELGLVQGAVIETIVYDKQRYERINNAPTWTESRNSRYDKNLTINQGNFTFTTDAALSIMGTVELGNVPTTQYQYWVLNKAVNEENGGQAVYDLFISNREGQTFVLRDRFSGRGEHEGLGQGELAYSFDYYDQGAPISITPPTPDQIQE